MKPIWIALPLALLLSNPAWSQSPAVDPPLGHVAFGWNEQGANDMERFQAPISHQPLFERGRAQISVDLRRFLFPAGCPDPDQIEHVALLLIDALGQQETLPLQITSNYASGQVDVPAGANVRLGFVATTLSGCEAHDTRFEAFYSFPLSSWKPALLRFEASALAPAASGSLTAGEHLVIEYELERSEVDGYGTDSHGSPKKLSHCRLWYKVGQTLSIFAKVRFLDAAGDQLGEIQGVPVVRGTYTQPYLREIQAWFRVPAGARRADVYLEAINYNGSCGWDSNHGQNFRFAVQPPASPGLTGNLPGN